FLGPTQELENILLNPAHSQSASFPIFVSGSDVLRTFFDCGSIHRACPHTRQSERTLICETIEHPAFGSKMGDGGIIWRLIEIKPRFLRVQKIDIKLQSIDFNFERPRRRAAFQNADL